MTLQGLPVYSVAEVGDYYAMRTDLSDGTSFWGLFDPRWAPDWIVNGQGPAKGAGMVFTVYRAKVTEDAHLRRRVRLISPRPVSA